MLFICLKNLVVIFCLWSHSSELGSLYLMKYPLKNFSNFAIFLEWKPTIHKKDFCLRQKYPSFRDILSSLVCHAGHKYPIHFAIEATFQVPFQLFHFFSRLTCFYHYNFLFILYYFLLVTSLVKNHATFTCDVFVFIVQRFCFYLFVNRLLRSKSYSKWKMEAIWRPLEESKNWFHIQTRKRSWIM